VHTSVGGYDAGMKRLSVKRVAGLLCYAASAFMVFVFGASVVNRLFWHRGYSAIEDAIVFAIMAVIAAAFAIVGYLLTRRR
jgi:hypothetical protein